MAHQRVEGSATCPGSELVRAWVPFKPFGRFLYCPDCGDLIDDMSAIERWFFAHVIALVWNGRVEVQD